MVSIFTAGFLLPLTCAGLMGFAIQRGATCTVAAMGEIVAKRRASRLIALAEASLWVAGGLVCVNALGIAPALPGGFAPGVETVLGGMLLGFGAWANRACVFGSIARIGSGEWAYLLTPAGFLGGIWSMRAIQGDLMAMPVAGRDLMGNKALVVLFVGFVLWRIWRFARSEPSRRSVWHPHHATIIIGITFTIMLVTVGAWAYTDLLGQLAQGNVAEAPWQLVLFAALLAGSVAGGKAGGLPMRIFPRLGVMARCFAGGFAMGWGSALIPGGNDGLILVGMPLLWPYAWLAIATMCATIAIALIIESKLSKDNAAVSA